jgi:hypothetical protein
MVLSLLRARFTLPVENRSLRQDQHGGHDVAENPRRLAELDPFATGDIAFDLSADNSHSYLNLGFKLPLLAQEKRIRTKQFTAEFAVHGYRPNEIETALRLAAMIDD